jgi:hypothetical protein
MGAIVSVYIDKQPATAEPILGELVRWADDAAGVSWSRGGDIVDFVFADADPGHARSEVENVLGLADRAWPAYLGIEAVATQ